ncbi:MAG: hypothetical protein RID91_00685 [Azospirillaceae bacterium]
MARKVTDIFGERNRPRLGAGRTGVTSPDTDSESGEEGTTDAAAELRALRVMRDRGLMSAEDFARRAAELGFPEKGEGEG